jgi:hypothetical protein
MFRKTAPVLNRHARHYKRIGGVNSARCRRRTDGDGIVTARLQLKNRRYGVVSKLAGVARNGSHTSYGAMSPGHEQLHVADVQLVGLPIFGGTPTNEPWKSAA